MAKPGRTTFPRKDLTGKKGDEESLKSHKNSWKNIPGIPFLTRIPWKRKLSGESQRGWNPGTWNSEGLILILTLGASKGMNPAQCRELGNAGASQSRDWDNPGAAAAARGSWEKWLGNGTGSRIFHGNQNIPGKNPRLRSNLQIGIKAAALFPLFFSLEFQGEGEALMRRQTALGAPKIFLKI